jgi:hypothetical protein
MEGKLKVTGLLLTSMKVNEAMPSKQREDCLPVIFKIKLEGVTCSRRVALPTVVMDAPESKREGP